MRHNKILVRLATDGGNGCHVCGLLGFVAFWITNGGNGCRVCGLLDFVAFWITDVISVGGLGSDFLDT
ncbi:MAG: hypothetical protein QNJ36_07140 [Calothrix sp. MO_167.B42]|nr:hypothetical protein [Calothrix sp. MO_167.B42]